MQMCITGSINAQNGLKILQEYMCTPTMLTSKLCTNSFLSEKVIKSPLILKGEIDKIERIGHINSLATGIPEGEYVIWLNCKAPYELVISLHSKILPKCRDLSVGDIVYIWGQIYVIEEYVISILPRNISTSLVTFANTSFFDPTEDMNIKNVSDDLFRRYLEERVGYVANKIK